MERQNNVDVSHKNERWTGLILQIKMKNYDIIIITKLNINLKTKNNQRKTFSKCIKQVKLHKKRM